MYFIFIFIWEKNVHLILMCILRITELFRLGGKLVQPPVPRHHLLVQNRLVRALSNQFLKTTSKRDLTATLDAVLVSNDSCSVFPHLVYPVTNFPLSNHDHCLSISCKHFWPHLIGTGLLIYAQSYSCSHLSQAYLKAYFCRGSALPPLNCLHWISSSQVFPEHTSIFLSLLFSIT